MNWIPWFWPTSKFLVPVICGLGKTSPSDITASETHQMFSPASKMSSCLLLSVHFRRQLTSIKIYFGKQLDPQPLSRLHELPPVSKPSCVKTPITLQQNAGTKSTESQTARETHQKTLLWRMKQEINYSGVLGREGQVQLKQRIIQEKKSYCESKDGGVLTLKPGSLNPTELFKITTEGKTIHAPKITQQEGLCSAHRWLKQEN